VIILIISTLEICNNQIWRTALHSRQIINLSYEPEIERES
jgi:hypothetical protein